MRHFCRHDDRLAGFDDMLSIADCDARRTVKNGHHGVAMRCVRADLFILVESKQGQADMLVLGQCLADDLAFLVLDQFFSCRTVALSIFFISGLFMVVLLYLFLRIFS